MGMCPRFAIGRIAASTAMSRVECCRWTGAAASVTRQALSENDRSRVGTACKGTPLPTLRTTSPERHPPEKSAVVVASLRPIPDAIHGAGTRSNVLKLRSIGELHAAAEAFMRTTPLFLITLAALSLPTIGARADGSWCASYGSGFSGTNCSFSSFEQCRATLSGIGGFCRPNPYPGTNYGRAGTWSSAPIERGR